MTRIVNLLCGILLLNCITGEHLRIPVTPRIHDEYNLALEAIFSMGIRLQALLYKPNIEDKNFLISPISATTLIAELMLGAEGETLKELHDLISLPNDENAKSVNSKIPYSDLHSQLSRLLSKLNNFTTKKHFSLESPNFLFYNKNELLYSEFLERLRMYNTYTYPLDFTKDPKGSQIFMNHMANKSTHGLIKEFLPYPPTKDTSAIFGNILYFKADWEEPFSYQLNRKGQFFVQDQRTVNVTYMMAEMESIPYYESKDLDCKMIALPYKDKELSMYIILPSSDVYDIKDFVRKLKLKDVLKMVYNLEEHFVSVKIPKLTLTTTLELLKPLKKYAAFKKTEILNNTSNHHIFSEMDRKIDLFSNFNVTKDVDILLTSASKLHPLRVSNIVQQVKLCIDEKGTEAAAITASSIDYLGSTRNFYVDKPFTFFIRHEETSAVLFWGTIVDPTQTN